MGEHELLVLLGRPLAVELLGCRAGNCLGIENPANGDCIYFYVMFLMSSLFRFFSYTVLWISSESEELANYILVKHRCLNSKLWRGEGPQGIVFEIWSE